jgi:peptide/nickel transport system permease protein
MADRASERMTERKRHSFLAEAGIRLVKEKPLGTVGGIITLLLLLTGIFAPFIAPYGMNEIHTAHMLKPSSAKFWLGTDNLGRDILSRVIFGARVSMIVALAASSIAVVISLTIGLVCGYLGGKIDLIVQRFVDSWMCIPSLILCMAIISMIGPSMMSVIIILGIGKGIHGSRVMRSATVSIRENVYVGAAKAIGCPARRILTRHILPNVMAPLIIQFTTGVPNIILVEASLSFLGFGIPPPVPSWGGMLSGPGRQYLFLGPWMALWPGLALSIVVFGINMFGDAVRDILDPSLKGAGRRYEVRAKKEVKKLATASY